jgi:hypothetical protein
MALFTFAPNLADAAGDHVEVECPDAVTAIKQARGGRLQAIIDESPMVERASIGIGEGTGEAIHWLGAWDWSDDGDR